MKVSFSTMQSKQITTTNQSRSPIKTEQNNAIKTDQNRSPICRYEGDTAPMQFKLSNTIKRYPHGHQTVQIGYTLTELIGLNIYIYISTHLTDSRQVSNPLLL
eukprot:63811_1